MMERLQKVISQAGVASRRHAEKLITDRRVSVNGKIVAELGTKVDPARDVVAVDNEPLTREKKYYCLLYKPRGMVTTLSDPEGRRTVATLVADVPARLYPVGRLDYNTEGVLLLTNDGPLTNLLTHPSHNILKTYIAEVVGRPAEDNLDKLRIGINLSDGVTAPAKIKIMKYDHENDTTKIEIIISEGRNRQVRRMCEAIGHPVNKLKRVKFAFLTLEGLRRGRYRHLSLDEVSELKQLANPVDKADR